MQQRVKPRKGVAEMGRQRTINDQNFWHSPKLFNCTTEDKVALLHLLTGPVSNIIGVYSILPRIAGAEIGWTADQWLQVIGRLQEADLARFDRQKMVVWVGVWWDHHNASQVTGPKLRARTRQEILNVPPEWQEDFVTDLKSRLINREQQAWIDKVMQRSDDDTSAIPDGYGIDTVSESVVDNTNYQPKQKQVKETTTLRGSTTFDLSKIPPDKRLDVHNALAQTMENKTLIRDPQMVVDLMVKKFTSTANPPKSAFALTHNLATRKDLNI